MAYINKYVMLKRLCKEYSLQFVDCKELLGYSYLYIGSHWDPMRYIDKISPDQLEAMSPGQIEDLVVQCALTDIGSEDNGQD